MGLFIRQDENRSHFQEKLASELRQRAAIQANGAEPNDQSKDSNYMKDTVQTSDRMGLWLLAIVVAVVAGSIVFLFVR